MKAMADFDDPKLKHFLAEHAHPSLEVRLLPLACIRHHTYLQFACRQLEKNMTRLNLVIKRVLDKQGKHVERDYAVQHGLATVIEHNLAMVAAISRASRSYSIGLRNCDLEVWNAIRIRPSISASNVSRRL